MTNQDLLRLEIREGIEKLRSITQKQKDKTMDMALKHDEKSEDFKKLARKETDLLNKAIDLLYTHIEVSRSVQNYQDALLYNEIEQLYDVMILMLGYMDASTRASSESVQLDFKNKIEEIHMRYDISHEAILRHLEKVKKQNEEIERKTAHRSD